MKNSKNKFDGIIRACGEAIVQKKTHFDVTSLWKQARQESDILDVIAKATSVLERTYPGLGLSIKMADDMSLSANISQATGVQITNAEEYLKKQMLQRNKSISFHQLRRFYERDALLQELKGFFEYIKTLFVKMLELVTKPFTYKICKSKAKILIQY